MKFQIHKAIHEKLNNFIETKKVPNILFYGQSGSGKKTILADFLSKIYSNTPNSEEQILKVNCSHGKGIKFIREELIFFGKTNINSKDGEIFKSIILLNAEKLTTDAQSALRRCIETFSHNTRFFIVVEDKDKILKPILSRFCEIHVNYPKIGTRHVNLHKYITKQLYSVGTEIKNLNWIERNVKFDEPDDAYYLKKCEDAYNAGVSALDIMQFLEKKQTPHDELSRAKLLMYFDKIKTQFRNEKNIMFFMFIYIFMRNEHSLENVLSI
jgi:Cdc6-like AAA superfamily ATPase